MERIKNKKALFNYEVLETFEAGISLFGHEVKAIKSGRLNFTGSYISLRGGEAFLVGASISPYQMSNLKGRDENYEQTRPRKLLLSKKELKELSQTEHQKGLTIVPISMYNKGNKIKLEIGIVRGKKRADKRETLKKRDADREINRTLKYR